MNRQRFLITGCIIVFLIVLLAACGAGDEGNNAALPPNQAAPGIASVADQPADAGAPAESESGEVDRVVTDAEQRAQQQRDTPRMVIKNGELGLMVENVHAAINRITTTAAEYNGYVISSETTSNGAYPTGTITIAVESATFETAMNDLREIGMKVLHDAATGQDVTSEYVDQESRLRSLEATRDRIMSFLEDAETVPEALQVNEQLKQIEGEIEQVKGRMNFLAGRAAFSTITISLREPDPPATPTPTPSPEPGWSARATIDKAFDAQESLVKLLADAIIWLGIFVGPYLLVAGVIVLGWRRWGRRS